MSRTIVRTTSLSLVILAMMCLSTELSHGASRVSFLENLFANNVLQARDKQGSTSHVTQPSDVIDQDDDVRGQNDGVDLENADLRDDRMVRALHEQWRKKFNKSFKTAKDRNSSLIRLRTTAERIKKFNARRDATYKMGLNEFSDWPFEDVKKYLLGYKEIAPNNETQDNNNTNNNNSSSSNNNNNNNPNSKGRKKRDLTYRDWGAEGYVNSVQNQGSCASCWAFTAAAALEAAYKKRYGWLPSLSPQELVECDYPYVGCNGGQTYAAITYTNRYYGIASLANYPYVSQYGSYSGCSRASKPRVSIGGAQYSQITANSDSALLNYLANYGPVATAVSVANGFQNYRSGILDSSACGTDLNHAVLLTGFGVDSATGIKYWKVKNTWGSGWGESGYVRINRNQLNACGLTKVALAVTVS